MKFYAIQQADREAHVYIFGDITSWRWDPSDTSAWSLTQEIKDLDVDVIHVHVDSYGGEVAEGWAIYNTLRQHKAKIVTYADGFVASAAIYPFMAGDQRIANSVAAFYFHQAMVGAYGNADQLRSAADDVEKLNDLGLNAFGDLGIDTDKILQIERDETWLTPEEALELGIATEIRARSGESKRASQSIRGMIVQAVTAKRQAPAEIEGAPAVTPEQNTPVNHLAGFLGGLK